MSLTLPMNAVSDTAFLTAFCRAVETERADAHFHDPHARQLAGPRGEQLLQRFPGGSENANGCIVRTCILDSLVMQVLRDHAVGTVINLGAGLDTRPYRLPLTSVSWFDVDCEGVLAYKANVLGGCRPRCSLHSVAIDVTNIHDRREFFGQVVNCGSRVLIITEGLLIYLTREQV